MQSRPDKPLVVKCTFNDHWNKKISFSSARNCTYELLRAKVEQCFSLYSTSYAIAYKDDDGEVTTILNEYDLTEAVQYFQAGGDDVPISSAASILSGRSFGSRKITLKVDITVEYDGPSLSDTSSLASLEEYRARNGSQRSLSIDGFSVPEQDDDSVTVSSRDPGMHSSLPRARSPMPSHAEEEENSSGMQLSDGDSISLPDDPFTDPKNGIATSDMSSPGASLESPFSDGHLAQPRIDDPSAVFERLKLSEDAAEGSVGNDNEMLSNERSTAWLREQKSQAIKSALGILPEPSESDAASLKQEYQNSAGPSISGGLALERGPGGKYYYFYTSSASQSHVSGDEEGLMLNGDGDGFSLEDNMSNAQPRPTSMQLNWLASQQSAHPHAPNRASSEPVASTSRIDAQTSRSDPCIRHQNGVEICDDIPADVLQFVSVESPPQHTLTDCSSCGTLLEYMRYICSTCGEKKSVFDLAQEDIPERPSGLGKSPSSSIGSGSMEDMSYPPSSHRTLVSPPSQISPSSSSSSLGGLFKGTLKRGNLYKPLPSLPVLQHSPEHSPTQSMLSVPQEGVHRGYELCPSCIELEGVTHALAQSLAPGSPLPPSVADSERAMLQWRIAAPAKGKLRHAFKEMIWGPRGWEHVEQSDAKHCSTCKSALIGKRYKCTSCNNFNLCRACYSQVHEIHPSHAFLVVPETPQRSHSDSELPQTVFEDPIEPEEQSLKHPGVKCAHCLMDIVGARFHCAECDSIDICSNCESAGLPGNLDSADGGHSSSHIMIKIPYPLETDELHSASRRAVNLWTARDAAAVSGRTRRNSLDARTVVGAGFRETVPEKLMNHHVYCNGCEKVVVGVRYQCASCPSSPQAYNLCSSCEERSYLIHNPLHIFFKIPRPVDHQLEIPHPILPRMYKRPVGPPPGFSSPDPKAYLKTLVHETALCDRCMTKIQGAWFHCAYCPTDLCDSCEVLDTHDDTHVFVVFKSIVDMQILRRYIPDLENPNLGPPLIPHPLYNSS